MAKPAGYGKPIEVEPGYPELGWREDLAATHRKIEALRVKERQIVGQALAAGVTLSEIARALGISRQSAHQRYGSLRIEVRSGSPGGRAPALSGGRPGVPDGPGGDRQRGSTP